MTVYFSPENKILDLSESKAFADDQVAQIMQFIFDRAENIVIGENDSILHFLLFPMMSSKGFCLGH